MGAGASSSEGLLARSSSAQVGGHSTNSRAIALDLELQRRLVHGSPLSPQQERALLDRRAWLEGLGGSVVGAADEPALLCTSLSRQLDTAFEGVGHEPGDAPEQSRMADQTGSDNEVTTEPAGMMARVSSAEQTRMNELMAQVVDLLDTVEVEATLEWQTYECTNAAQRVEVACLRVEKDRANLVAIIKAAKQMGCKISHASHQTDELQNQANRFLATIQQESDGCGAALDQSTPPECQTVLANARDAFEYAMYRWVKKGYNCRCMPLRSVC